ncbi:MAG: hypothetical protein M0000_08715 [Actinomycetota bacterium]|nr:hypothetical protein [Actinomycetota bacterium]
MQFATQAWPQPIQGTEKQRPAHRFSAGDLQAAMWVNGGTYGHAFTTVVLERRFRLPDGTWKSTRRLRGQDLEHAITLLQRVLAVTRDIAEGTE